MAISQKMTSRKLAQRIVRSVYPYGSVRTVRRGPLKGYKIMVGPSMGVSYLWDLDAESWAWVKSICPGQCVYDVGSNFGQSTLRLSRAVGHPGQVIAFEPMPAAFRGLTRNLELNEARNVTPVNAAAAGSTGTGKFEINPHLPDQGSLDGLSSQGGEMIEVRYVALDDYASLGWRAPDLLKIDVEGGGRFVIEGAQRLLSSVRPRIYFELHNQEEHDAVALLKDRYGYAIYDLQGRWQDDPGTAYYCGPLMCLPTSK